MTVKAIMAGLIAATFASEALANEELCADPASFCTKDLRPVCLDKFGAGSVSIGDEGCRESLRGYSRCLEKAAAECGGPASEESFSLSCTITNIEAPNAEIYKNSMSGNALLKEKMEQMIATEQRDARKNIEAYSLKPEYSIVNGVSFFDWQLGKFLPLQDDSGDNSFKAYSTTGATLQIEIDRISATYDLSRITTTGHAKAKGRCAKIDYKPVQTKRAF